VSRATNDILDGLHGLLAGALKDELGRAIKAAERAEDPAPINPQLIDKVLKFLKDNGVDAPRNNKPVNDLALELGSLDLDDPEVAGTLRH
jgi:hypothetical protein